MGLFSERLRMCRLEKNISQEDLAHELQLRYSTYCRYERGGTEPAISNAARMADYFGVSLDYLAGRTERKEFLP